MEINDLTKAIIGAAIEVHKRLGPGLLESASQQSKTVPLLPGVLINSSRRRRFRWPGRAM